MLMHTFLCSVCIFDIMVLLLTTSDPCHVLLYSSCICMVRVHRFIRASVSVRIERLALTNGRGIRRFCLSKRHSLQLFHLRIHFNIIIVESEPLKSAVLYICEI